MFSKWRFLAFNSRNLQRLLSGQSIKIQMVAPTTTMLELESRCGKNLRHLLTGKVSQGIIETSTYMYKA